MTFAPLNNARLRASLHRARALTSARIALVTRISLSSATPVQAAAINLLAGNKDAVEACTSRQDGIFLPRSGFQACRGRLSANQIRLVVVSPRGSPKIYDVVVLFSLPFRVSRPRSPCRRPRTCRRQNLLRRHCPSDDARVARRHHDAKQGDGREKMRTFDS